METMILYQPGVEADLLVAAAWARIRESGDLERFVSPGAHPLSGFMGLCMPPRITVFEMDEKGPAMLGILEQCFDGAFMSYWCAPEWRPTKYVLTTFLHMLKLALEQFPCIIGITKQKHLIETHLRLGYTLRGELPNFWGGETAYILVLTREAFQPILKKYAKVIRADINLRNSMSVIKGTI